MENAPEEEANEFMEPGDEIVEGDEQHVEHEEVLEEIVHGDEMLIQYQNVVMYEDGSEVIEEYVEVEDLGNDNYAYVMTDEHGNRRLLRPEEVESVKKEMPMLVEELVEQKDDGAGPSTSDGYKPRGRFAGGKASDKGRALYMDRGGYHYHESPTKRLGDLAKVDVEKYVPAVTVNRRPLPDNADFVKPKQHRSRKNPPWQDEEVARVRPVRTPSPIIMKEPLFAAEDDDMNSRFKCNECDQEYPIIDRLCDHMTKNHDCQATIREVEFFNERDFETFLFKIEKQSLGREADPHKTFTQSRRSRSNTSQLFVCNYMSKKRKKHPELVEVSMARLAERPMEACTAFVQKSHNFECIRVRYCDHHVHNDGNIGFRVPLTVKRRLFEMSIKRLPIPCMQVLLAHEAENLMPHPSKFEEKLKHLSHVEIVELLGLINANLGKSHDHLDNIRGRRVPIKFETITTDDGQETLVVVRANSPSPKPSTSDQRASSGGQSLEFTVDGEDVPMMAREEEVQEEEETVTPPDASGGFMNEKMLYDPSNDQDPRLDELTETELGILEAYERDIGVQLSEDQRRERNKYKAKFQLNKIITLYNSLDAATHGLSSNELHMETINELRDMASYVVEIVCTLDAEIKAQFNPALSVDDIKRDMIAGIAMQERSYNPDRRRRSAGTSLSASPMKPYQPRNPSVSRNHEEYAARILSKVKAMQPPHRAVGINMSGTFDLSSAERVHAVRQQSRSEPQNTESRSSQLPPPEESIPEEQKPGTSGLPSLHPLPPLPDAYKSVPWSKPARRKPTVDPNAPAKKRGRPNKKTDRVTPAAAPVVAEEGVITSGALEVGQVPKTVRASESGNASETAAPSAASDAPTSSHKPSSSRSKQVSTSSDDQSKTATAAPVSGESIVVRADSDSQKSQTSTESEEMTSETSVAAPEEPAPAADATSTTSSDAVAAPTPTTTRTGRVVRKKKFGDE